jgi:hypothetical protein
MTHSVLIGNYMDVTTFGSSLKPATICSLYESWLGYWSFSLIL